MNKESRDRRLPALIVSIKQFDKNILFIFFIYSILRLFLEFKTYWIWGDEAKYLACAKSFPFNRMFDHPFRGVQFASNNFNALFAQHEFVGSMCKKRAAALFNILTICPLKGGRTL